MAGKPQDITGERFGELTAVALVGKDAHGHVRWQCSCKCGGTRIATINRLRAGRVTSCGCARGKYPRPGKRAAIVAAPLPDAVGIGVRLFDRMTAADRDQLRIAIAEFIAYAKKRRAAGLAAAGDV